MAGGSIETTLELWASSLRDVKGRMRGLFTQKRVAQSAGLFLDGLLGDERRKTGWMRAEAAGDPGPWRQQAILGRGRWDPDARIRILKGFSDEFEKRNLPFIAVMHAPDHANDDRNWHFHLVYHDRPTRRFTGMADDRLWDLPADAPKQVADRHKITKAGLATRPLHRWITLSFAI